MTDRQELDVLHLIGTLSPGGAERNLYYLAPYLRKSKLRYGICCLMRRGEFADEIERLGIPVFEMGYRRRYAIQTLLKLRRLLIERKVAVVHTHLFESGVMGRLAAWLARVPVIITHEHGKTLWKRWHHTMFERFAIRFTDQRIAVSKDIMNLRLRREGTPPDKIRIVFNAVDPERFDLDQAARASKRKELGLEGSLVVGTIGRLVEAKAYDLLLDVAHEACSLRGDLRFILVGEGPLRQELERKRDRMGMGERFQLLGQRTDIPELIAAMDAYIITSLREGMPITLIEAMMSAKPIVSTAVGGIPDTLADDEDGLLVEAGTSEALVEALMGLLERPEKMRDFGLKAREKALKWYAPEKVLDQLEAIYAEIMNRKGIAHKRIGQSHNS
jgi:glycosyltransferase involved in cell wall biosynthesis